MVSQRRKLPPAVDVLQEHLRFPLCDIHMCCAMRRLDACQQLGKGSLTMVFRTSAVIRSYESTSISSVLKTLQIVSLLFCGKVQSH